MVRTAPDYSNVRAGEPLHRLDDMAELAVRLGSPDRFSREGNVVYLTNFENGMPSWETAANGTGASVGLSAEHARSGSFSVEMVGGSDGVGSAQISKAFPYPVLSKYSFECSFIFLHEVQYLILTLGLRDGAEEHQYQITYEPAAEEVRVTIPGGSSVTVLEDIDLSVGSGLFHTIKFIADLENGNYERIIVDEESLGLTDYEPYTFAHVSSPHINIIVTLYSNSGDNDTIYVDDIIVKQGEP